MPRSVTPDTKQPQQSAAEANTADALVAAAITVSSSINRRKYRKTEPWQTEAWGHYDGRGPLRYATSWFANALSRAKLVPAHVDPIKGITPITSGPAYDAMRELMGGYDGGTSALLKAMGQHYFIAGEWYLVGRGARPEDDRITSANEIWEVVSVEEMKVTGSGKNEKWSIDYGDGDKIPLGANDVIIRMWCPHPRRRTQPDSPVRAALGDLNELRILSEHIGAQVFSRLAGAGMLLLPSETTFAKPPNAPVNVSDTADPLMVALGHVMTTAVDDPGSVESLVPIILRAPGEHLDKVRHLTFWSELDDKAIEMRQDAIRNLAISLDLPPEVLTGTADVNHWGAWQIEESSIKAHIEPALEVIAGSLTTAYLRKVVDDPTIIVAYDTSALRLRPNRSKEALELYDRGELNGAALRRETGFENDDAHTDKTYEAWLLKKVATGSATPDMVNAALAQLGIDLGPGLGDTGNNEARPDPSLQQHPTYEPPERDQTASLMATCNALAYRAFERAGNRLRNKSSSRPDGVAPEEMHCYVPVDPAGANLLLEDAWRQLPALLGHVDVDPLVVERSLDAYVRAALTTGQRHNSDLMQRFIYAALEQAS